MAKKPRDRDGARLALTFDQPSQTQQSFREASDINQIMRKFVRTQVIDHLNRYEGKYADVSGVVDYQEALGIISRADEAFMTLPATIRADFSNSPHAFLEFAIDPANKEKMEEYGLSRKGPPENPDPPDAKQSSDEKPAAEAPTDDSAE